MSYARDMISISVLSSELVWLNNALHLLDHRKGEAEKRLARIRDEETGTSECKDEGERVRETENEVGEMEEIHDQYVERLGRLRDRVINEIDKLLVEDTLTKEVRKSVSSRGHR